MEALKVTFTFATPLLIDSDYPIHMDAIIASAVCRLAESMGSENPWRDADDLSGYLDKTSGDNWVWKASRLIFTPASGINFQNQIRKSDPARYLQDLGNYWVGKKPSDDRPLGSINPETFKIDTRSGQQRGYQWLISSQWMAKAEAWIIGDKEALEDLLKSITHIGKMGRNDYGRIKNMTIESTSEVERWKLRVLPVNEIGLSGVDYELVNACLRAPYWKDINRGQVKEPLI